MKDFAAIDFETANFHRSSVCSVGVVIYRNGQEVDEFYSLIKPEPEYYNSVCSEVNGLSVQDTADAPIFPEVWKQVMPKIDGLPLVAHNKAFDENCLKAVFGCYRMDYPDYEFHCTLQESRKLWPGIPHNLDVIILIVEVKSGNDFKKHTALNNVLELARDSTNLNIEQSFVFCKSNVEKAEKIVYAPLYMAAFL